MDKSRKFIPVSNASIVIDQVSENQMRKLLTNILSLLHNVDLRKQLSEHDDTNQKLINLLPPIPGIDKQIAEAQTEVQRVKDIISPPILPIPPVP